MQNYHLCSIFLKMCIWKRKYSENKVQIYISTKHVLTFQTISQFISNPKKHKIKVKLRSLIRCSIFLIIMPIVYVYKQISNSKAQVLWSYTCTFKPRIKVATCVCMFQGYGMTEAGPVLSMSLGFAKQPFTTKSGSCGTVVRNAELKVLDHETGRSLGYNQPGEICIRGHQIMKGKYTSTAYYI